MTPKERAALADDLKRNPLFSALLDGLETSAIERMVYAKTDEDRLVAQLRVQAVRHFRSDCEAALRNNDSEKSAPV